ncbi:MAG: PBP1A family penicillin-binding protein [Anaerolineae bacterium]|nr:PBP1A family penicillin-binding protein [Anaerolineae bacterium]
MLACRRRRCIAAVVVCLILFAAACLVTWWWLFADLPHLDGVESPALGGYTGVPSSKIYDRNGRLLFEMLPPDTGLHSPVPIDEIPLALRQAVVATEDATFYANPGVDAWAIVRAVWINLRGGEVLSGGSTITQQVARNLLFTPDERYERTLRRKLREAVLAWRIARRYEKDEVLALYLNEIYFGNMAYGVEAAAQAYFAKPVRDLDLAECAMLAGLPQAPALYNPLENLEAARERQGVVLDLMVKHGYLTVERAELARREKLYFASAPFEIRAPHFVMYVRGLLERELGLERLEQGGLNIYTTLDLDLNETARDLVRYRLARLAECNGQRDACPPGGRNVRNAALVALDPETGEILAMLGSPDYFSARIDGAVNGTTVLRQPGSAVKPLTYAAAFDTGELTAATVMVDERTAFVTKEGEPYVPLNYDLQFRGPVRLREALASSYNVIAVKVLDRIGVESMAALARRLGITTFDDSDRLGLSVTLGGGEVRLLELTAAYGALANGGERVRPVAIRRVEDAAGNLVWAPVLEEAQRVLDERVAYLVSDVLSDPVARIPSFGEASALELSRPAAVKTGTTTDFRDNWTVGYTPDLVVGVWAGNADGEAMREISGISGAAPIWHDFMEAALKGQPVHLFERPEGLVEVEVCATTGLLPGENCSQRLRELFIAGTEPVEVGDSGYWVLDIGDSGAGEVRAGSMNPESRVADARVSRPTPSPALVLTAPDRNATYRIDASLARDAQRIAVSARAGMALREVVLLVDGREVARFSAPPYEALWVLEPGAHVFVARGIDGAGEVVMSDQVCVQVKE